MAAFGFINAPTRPTPAPTVLADMVSDHTVADSSTPSQKLPCKVIVAESLSLAAFIAMCVHIGLCATHTTSNLWLGPICLSALNLAFWFEAHTWQLVATRQRWIVYFPLCVALCVHIGQGLQFFVSSTCILVVIAPLTPLSVSGLIRYEFGSLGYTAACMASYGTLRALCAAATDEGLPVVIADLIPFMLSTLETLGMIVCKSTSYAFSTRSTQFTIYASTKGSAFLALPHVERALLLRL